MLKEKVQNEKLLSMFFIEIEVGQVAIRLLTQNYLFHGLHEINDLVSAVTSTFDLLEDQNLKIMC